MTRPSPDRYAIEPEVVEAMDCFDRLVQREPDPTMRATLRRGRAEVERRIRADLVRQLEVIEARHLRDCGRLH